MGSVMTRFGITGLISFCITGFMSCSPVETISPTEWTDLSIRPKPAAITNKPWQEVVINVEKFEDIAPLFQEIGKFETLEQTETNLLLGGQGADGSYIRLKKIGKADPARPATSRAWDKGCYFSLMMRAKNLPSIINDAEALGWTPLTEMAYLEFGPSKLNIIVLTHETGVRVQLYERLVRPIPKAFPPFERLSRPFNVMQMVEDRDAGYDFFQQQLGFDTFFYGKPYVSKKEEIMPLGIPPKLTSSIPYKTAIMTPKMGLEWGRMEMIDIEKMKDGVNYSDRCNDKHTGIVKVRFPVSDIEDTRKKLKSRKVTLGQSSYGTLQVKTPDGANIEFYQE